MDAANPDLAANSRVREWLRETERCLYFPAAPHRKDPL